jgi:hypothetical protein
LIKYFLFFPLARHIPAVPGPDGGGGGCCGRPSKHQRSVSPQQRQVFLIFLSLFTIVTQTQINPPSVQRILFFDKKYLSNWKKNTNQPMLPFILFYSTFSLIIMFIGVTHS